jgi:shikimate kinase
MNIFIIGLTGAGKSTIGKLLANKLAYTFLDLDDLIQFETKRTIEHIFEKDSEQEFRKLEQKYLKIAASRKYQVISTGGGTPCFFDNMDFIKNNGLSIFLYAPVQIVAERLLNSDPRQRPMLKGKSKEELYDFLETKLAERLPFYARADFSIDTNVPKSPDKIVKTLLDVTKQIEPHIELNIQLQQQQ